MGQFSPRLSPFRLRESSFRLKMFKLEVFVPKYSKSTVYGACSSKAFSKYKVSLSTDTKCPLPSFQDEAYISKATRLLKRPEEQ